MGGRIRTRGRGGSEDLKFEINLIVLLCTFVFLRCSVVPSAMDIEYEVVTVEMIHTNAFESMRPNSCS